MSFDRVCIETGKNDFGILICGSANGVSITANKHQNISAAIAWENVVAVAGEILAGICVAQAKSPNGEVRYGTSGVEVTERLPFYRERRESLKTRAQK